MGLIKVWGGWGKYREKGRRTEMWSVVAWTQKTVLNKWLHLPPPGGEKKKKEGGGSTKKIHYSDKKVFY